MKSKISILFTILLVACGAEKRADNAVVFEQQVTVNGVEYGEEIVAQPPSQIELIDSMLLLFRPGGCAAKGMDIKTGKNLGVVWANGKGQNEFFLPYFAGKNNADSSFAIYDMNLRSLNNYKWSKKDGTLSFELQSQQRNTGDYGLFFTERLDNGYMISRIISGADSVLILSDDKFNFVANFCNPLNVKTEDMSELSGSFASMGNKFVYATINFGYIVCYDVTDNGKLIKNWEYMISEPTYTMSPEFKIDRSKNIDGFYDVKMTDDYIFCLYSGKILDFKIPSLPDKLFVFNHKGEPITEMTLNPGCGRFAVTNDNKTIYSLNQDANRIVKYNISKAL